MSFWRYRSGTYHTPSFYYPYLCIWESKTLNPWTHLLQRIPSHHRVALHRMETCPMTTTHPALMDRYLSRCIYPLLGWSESRNDRNPRYRLWRTLWLWVFAHVLAHVSWMNSPRETPLLLSQALSHILWNDAFREWSPQVSSLRRSPPLCWLLWESFCLAVWKCSSDFPRNRRSQCTEISGDSRRTKYDGSLSHHVLWDFRLLYTEQETLVFRERTRALRSFYHGSLYLLEKRNPRYSSCLRNHRSRWTRVPVSTLQKTIYRHHDSRDPRPWDAFYPVLVNCWSHHRKSWINSRAYRADED